MEDRQSEDSEKKLAGAAEYVEAEFTVEGMDSVPSEEEVRASLTGLSGIENVSVSSGKATVCYDPTFITKDGLSEAIARAGYKVADSEVERASPFAES